MSCTTLRKDLIPKSESFKYTESTRQRVEREALNRLNLIYNFRKDAFTQDEKGNWKHSIVFKSPTDSDVYGQTHTK